MKFMVTWSVRPDLLKSAVTRFLSSGGPVPQGVKTLGRWHKADGSGGFHLLETEDLKGVLQHAADWADLLDVTVAPVLEDADVTPIYSAAFQQK